jgi:hypothetical protein
MAKDGAGVDTWWKHTGNNQLNVPIVLSSGWACETEQQHPPESPGPCNDHDSQPFPNRYLDVVGSLIPTSPYLYSDATTVPLG